MTVEPSMTKLKLSYLRILSIVLTIATAVNHKMAQRTRLSALLASYLEGVSVGHVRRLLLGGAIPRITDAMLLNSISSLLGLTVASRPADPSSKPSDAAKTKSTTPGRPLFLPSATRVMDLSALEFSEDVLVFIGIDVKATPATLDGYARCPLDRPPYRNIERQARGSVIGFVLRFSSQEDREKVDNLKRHDVRVETARVYPEDGKGEDADLWIYEDIRTREIAAEPWVIVENKGAKEGIHDWELAPSMFGDDD